MFTYVLVGKKKTIFSYALLSGGPAIITCHDTVVLYIQYATSKGSDATAHLEPSPFANIYYFEISKGAKIKNRYNQVPHLTQDTNGKVTNSQLDTTNDSQKVSPFPAGDHKAHINRRAQRHSKHKTEQKHKRSTKEVLPCNVSKIFYWRA